MLAWQEIRQRYRRSVLGPFWLTISTGVLLAGMGPLYGRLLGQGLGNYFSYLSIGYVLWLLLSGLIIEGCSTFTVAAGLIQQTPMPLSVHVLRVVFRNLIVFAHNLIILVIVLVIFPSPMSWGLLLAPIGLLFIGLNGVWVGLLVGLLCARFRDIPLIIQSVMQVAFFLTPVMWKASSLGRHRWAADANPLTHFLATVRDPLLGLPVPWQSWAVVIGVTVVGCGAAFAFFARYRARIAYWV
jgi:ABC-2 type transport system permease protein